MATWLYQMSGKAWAPERYREEIWEGDETSWPQGAVRGGQPESGDSITLWYARSVSDDPGLYGWGVILGAREGVIRWRPVAPSDYLKMDPLFDQKLSGLVDEIRGVSDRGRCGSSMQSRSV